MGSDLPHTAIFDLMKLSKTIQKGDIYAHIIGKNTSKHHSCITRSSSRATDSRATVVGCIKKKHRSTGEKIRKSIFWYSNCPSSINCIKSIKTLIFPNQTGQQQPNKNLSPSLSSSVLGSSHIL